jgi:hypothetical protein
MSVEQMELKQPSLRHTYGSNEFDDIGAASKQSNPMSRLQNDLERRYEGDIWGEREEDVND